MGNTWFRNQNDIERYTIRSLGSYLSSLPPIIQMICQVKGISFIRSILFMHTHCSAPWFFLSFSATLHFH